MANTHKRKINRAIYIVILLILAVWITIAVTTCGGEKKDTGTKVTYVEAYITSKKLVKARLISPSTADFPYACDYSQTNDTSFIIKSYVDSQNGFGATLRTNYVMTLIYTGGKQGNWHDVNNWTELTFKTY